MTEIIFLVETDDDGGYVAQALGESIITQADDLETLKKEVKDAFLMKLYALKSFVFTLFTMRYLLHEIAQRFIRSRFSKIPKKVRL